MRPKLRQCTTRRATALLYLSRRGRQHETYTPARFNAHIPLYDRAKLMDLARVSVSSPNAPVCSAAHGNHDTNCVSRRGVTIRPHKAHRGSRQSRAHEATPVHRSTTCTHGNAHVRPTAHRHTLVFCSLTRQSGRPSSNVTRTPRLASRSDTMHPPKPAPTTITELMFSSSVVEPNDRKLRQLRLRHTFSVHQNCVLTNGSQCSIGWKAAGGCNLATPRKTSCRHHQRLRRR